MTSTAKMNVNNRTTLNTEDFDEFDLFAELIPLEKNSVFKQFRVLEEVIKTKILIIELNNFYQAH